ncbi:2-phosphosulfolactate phosphatase [Alteromonadaceae bacterium Bs31]|nr:2-phosphosulfolactate phosphatase [Alteromonadaceae bacterium Bs31]
MNINFADFVAGARNAQGIAVVIDVFRAFTTACYCFDAGCESLTAVGSSTKALALGKGCEAPILLGERYGKRLEGFDYGNSPSEIAQQDLRGKSIIHTTHAGTQGLVNAWQAECVVTGAFVNARATAAYIKKQSPEQVTLVRMGLNANEACDEDWLYADYLAALLREQVVDEHEIYQKLKASPYAARFFDLQQPCSPVEDFDCCLQFNLFDFVLVAKALEEDVCELTKISTGAVNQVQS